MRTQLTRQAGTAIDACGVFTARIGDGQQHLPAVANGTGRGTGGHGGLGQQLCRAGQQQLPLVTLGIGLRRIQANAAATGATGIQGAGQREVAVVHGNVDVVRLHQALCAQRHIALAHADVARLGKPGCIEFGIQGVKSAGVGSRGHVQGKATLRRQGRGVRTGHGSGCTAQAAIQADPAGGSALGRYRQTAGSSASG